MNRNQAPNDKPVRAREAWLKAKYHQLLSKQSDSKLAEIDGPMVVGNVLRYMDLPDDVTLKRAKELADDAIVEQIDHRRAK